MSSESKAFGSCACGAVKYEVTLPARFCVHCHCRQCRRMHGAAFVTWFGVPIPQFRVSGQQELRWFKAVEASRRSFCGKCGTPMFFVGAQWPGEVHVTRASLVHEADISPRFHIYFDQHVPWFPFEDSLPRLGGLYGTEHLVS
jgi:hypothetical protein